MLNDTELSIIESINKSTRKERTKQKLGLYLSPHSIMGYHNMIHFVVVGSRGRGKSVFSLDAAIAAKRKYGYENVKIFYFRISDLSVKAMLANKASKAIDPILMHKYDLDITTKNNVVYDKGKPLIEFYPLVSAGKVGKGVNLYDADFLNNRPIGKDGKPIKRFIFVIWDEFLMAEGVEKKSVGDPVAQFKIYLEAIFRDQEKLDYDAVRVFYLANTVSECASVTGQLFNYIPTPGDFEIKKLTRRHAVFWNVPNSQAYIDKRKKSYTADIFDYENDPNYTNMVKKDLDLIKPKRTRMSKVTQLIKFTKDRSDWFVLYDGKYIRQYRHESVKKDKIISMRRYLDENYNAENVLSVFERYDSKSYMYADIMSMSLFTAKLRELKK